MTKNGLLAFSRLAFGSSKNSLIFAKVFLVKPAPPNSTRVPLVSDEAAVEEEEEDVDGVGVEEVLSAIDLSLNSGGACIKAEQILVWRARTSSRRAIANGP